jgi:hypothetical protein
MNKPNQFIDFDVRRLAFSILLSLAFAALVVPTAFMAVALGLGLFALPYELSIVLQRLPIAFPLHMIASGLTLILIPIAAFTRHWPNVHRICGKSAATAVVVGGVTALFVALGSQASALARAGFFVQGLVWLGLLAIAVAAIHRREVMRHARFMAAMAAVASGAIWLRLVMLVAVKAGLPFEPVYALAAWACWLVPLGLTTTAMLGLKPLNQSRTTTIRSVPDSPPQASPGRPSIWRTFARGLSLGNVSNLSVFGSKR